MCLMKMKENLKKRMEWYHFSLLKLSVLFFTLFLVTVWPAFHDLVMKIAWYWYLIIWAVLSTPLCSIMWCKKCGAKKTTASSPKKVVKKKTTVRKTAKKKSKKRK